MKHVLLTLLVFGMGILNANADIGSTFQGTDMSTMDSTGVYYLYNVTTGQWFQANNSRQGHWVAYGDFGPDGLDLKVTQAGTPLHFNFDPGFNHNHSISPSNLSMESSDAITEWTATPIANSYGVSNSYKITAVIDSTVYTLGSGDDGFMSSQATNDTLWQFVSPTERLRILTATASAENPQLCSWLIPDSKFDKQNGRYYTNWQFSRKSDYSDYGSGDGNECTYNSLFEAWNVNDYTVQTNVNVPDGIYSISCSGFYSPCSSGDLDSKGNDYFAQYKAGTLANPSYFFAGDQKTVLPSIFDAVQTTSIDNMFTRSVGDNAYIPAHVWQISNAIMHGYYKISQPLTVQVIGGVLNLGASVSGGGGGSWFGLDQIEMYYLGNTIDVSVYKNILQSAIHEADTLEYVATDAMRNRINDAVAKGKELLANDSPSKEEISKVLNTLAQAKVTIIAMMPYVQIVQSTLKLATNEGVTNETTVEGKSIIDIASNALTNATSKDDIESVISPLRIARKIKCAETSPMPTVRNKVADGDFYLYNVGQKRWFCGGNSWGAHASLGFPGIQVTLSLQDDGAYTIDTHLNNGIDNGTPLEYLNWDAYCDTQWTGDHWAFKETKEGSCIYTISKTKEGETDHVLAYEANSYNNVTANTTDANYDGAQWILVKKTDRDALLSQATASNPVDASYYIQMPGFSQREGVSSNGTDQWEQIWSHIHGGIWGRGGDHPDFAFESWNDPETQLVQSIVGLPEGYYKLSAQGYYRDGDTYVHADIVASGEEPAQYAFLRAALSDDANSEVTEILPAIHEAANMVPGIGVQTSIGEYPNSIPDATEYFETGLYKVGGDDMILYVPAESTLEIGMIKPAGDGVKATDWSVIDNFRLIYFGKNDPTGIRYLHNDSSKKSIPQKIYNLQGIRLSKVSGHGIFIVDGKKIVK